MNEQEKTRLADQLVAAFVPLPEPLPASARLGEELRAIHEALQAVSEGQWEHAQELLRPVSRRTPFSHWVLFIKGLAAFHTGDRERAARFFESLPAGSVPAKASRLYLWIIRGAEPDGTTPTLREALLRSVCKLSGAAGTEGLLARAERLWQQGKHEDSYKVWREALPQFPAEGFHWLGAMSEFYFQSVHSTSGAAQDHYLEFFDSVLDFAEPKNAVEELLMRRTIALLDSRFGGGQSLRGNWEEFLQARERLHEPNPRFSSIAYGWLGEQLSRVCPDSFGFGGPRNPPVLSDANGAKDCLLKAIELDPANLEASLQLALVYRALKNKGKLNRLLDQMARRFPDEKRVLLESARNCIERSALAKALEYLERVRKLDRIDPQIAELLVSTRRQLARQHFASGQPGKGRLMLKPAEELLTDNADDFQRARWLAHLRHGLLERIHGDDEQGRALIEQARAACPFPVVFLLGAHVIHRIYSGSKGKDSPFLAALRAEVKRQPDAAQALALLRLFHSINHTADKPPLDAEQKMVRGYLSAAAKGPCTRAQAKQIVELCQPGQFREQARVFIRRMLREDPVDPWFRFHKLLLDLASFNPPGDTPATLESILQEAQRRGDQQLVQKVQGALRQVQQQQPMPMPMPIFGDLEDDEDEGEDVFDPMPPGPMDMNPEQEADMGTLLDMMRTMPESELRRMRKTVFKGVPDFIFETLLKTARNPGGRSNLPFPLPGPRVPHRPPRPKPPFVDPNQPDLF
jgi:tetratricopeptide (TPR) repeat protein